MKLDPIEYPKVELGGQQFEVKFTTGDVLILKKSFGVDLLSQPADMSGEQAIERMLTLLAVAISPKKVAPDIEGIKKSIADLSYQIDFADIPLYTAAIRDAQKKASERINMLMISTGLTPAPNPGTLTQ